MNHSSILGDLLNSSNDYEKNFVFNNSRLSFSNANHWKPPIIYIYPSIRRASNDKPEV